MNWFIRDTRHLLDTHRINFGHGLNDEGITNARNPSKICSKYAHENVIKEVEGSMIVGADGFLSRGMIYDILHSLFVFNIIVSEKTAVKYRPHLQFPRL